ncbi:hypothetical protein ACJIZ3_017113 [Penstemon smallii]|uniref:Uncharacterized protein n=1 Tax=Penstemon smallii TaxID=265156 RepID=A0ABD3SVC8_9LAMI
MADQENVLIHPQETEIDPEALKLLAMLHLNPSSSTAAAAHSPVSPSPLRASRKRRSPSNSSSSSKVQKKLLSKRTPLFPPSAVEIQEPPLLRRTFSEPIKYTTESPKIPEVFSGQVFSSFTSLPGGSSALSSPENTKNGGLLSKTSPLPPLPPPPHLRRTSSAPITTTMTPRPASRSPNPDKESSKGQRMERMKEIVQELAQVIEEGDEEDTLEIECNNKNDVEECENEEAVWVDENEGGGGLVVHFKCQCGKIYDVLFSGNNCYYRLI